LFEDFEIMRANETASVILLFIDGLGIGEKDEKNPLAQIEAVAPLAHFKNISAPVVDDGIMTPTDARLGVEGRPQSASGQTTILTGVNAPAALGYHKQGFPNQALREIINEHSIFRQLKNLGIEPNVFANAYTPQFFEAVPRWKSATTVAVEAAGIAFRRLPDLLGRHAVFHDFTNESLRERGFDVPVFSPAEAAAIVAGLAANHRFVLYEHFMTDKTGHEQDFEKARRLLPRLAEFIRAVVARADLEKTTVLLTSDHGNIEDLSVRQHTLNDVPTIVWGRKNRETAARIKSLADITPAIISLLSENV
jgi:2,3-bisphosphoglycerate-independent phosphoglycerate mutase